MVTTLLLLLEEGVSIFIAARRGEGVRIARTEWGRFGYVKEFQVACVTAAAYVSED